MNVASHQVVAALMLSACTSWASAAPPATTARQPGEVVIDGTRAQIVAFAPMGAQGSRDDGDIEGVAHTGFALQDTKRCLGTRAIEYRLVFADRLRIAGVRPPVVYRGVQLGQGFGAVLVRPGQPPRLVVSRDGPSTLQEFLPEAAAALWQAPACRPQP